MKEYQDIINLPHFHAPGYPHMPNIERAAQFMPFKSLKEYNTMIEDVAEKIEHE